MAAGVDQATIELLGLRGGSLGADPESEKIVLFFTDGQPTLPYEAGFEADNVRAVLRAADRARRAPASGSTPSRSARRPSTGPIATVEMAERTDGYFTPVRRPGDLGARDRAGELREHRRRHACATRRRAPTRTSSRSGPTAPSAPSCRSTPGRTGSR